MGIYNKLSELKEKNGPEADWVSNFRKKRDELRSIYIEDTGESEVVEFGYKVRREDELFVVVDWGNIEQFIAKQIAQAKRTGYSEALKNCGCDKCSLTVRR